MILPSSKTPIAILLSIATLSSLYPLIPSYVEWEQPTPTSVSNTAPIMNDTSADSVPAFDITQTEDEHVKQWNGSMYAIDIVSSDGNAYFPKAHNEYFIHHIGFDERLGNYVIIRHDKKRWVYGHTVTSRVTWYVNMEKDGNVLGQADMSWITTAKHTHIEIWQCPEKESKMKDCDNVSSTWQVAPRNDEIKKQRWWITDELDLDKLAYAVARHETGNCTVKRWSSLVNNCFGIRECSGGKCHGFKKYATKEESYKAFKDLWVRWYGWEFPTMQHAIKYSGNDRAEIWLKNVLYFYGS